MELKKEMGMPNFVEMEEKIIKFWEDNKSFEKLKEKNKNSEKHYKFLDGPITANNEMGIHHVWGRSLKDTYLKYKGMKGYSAHYQNGFDAHGTPVEVAVEKELGIKDKKELIDYGLNNFVEACLGRVEHYADKLTQQSIRLGQWMDWDDSYYTNSDDNTTAIWHFLKTCNEKGWLQLSYKPMMWCPRCGTSLSDHEMTGSYKDIEHTAVFIKLPVKEMDAKILVWTTTPWTLSSNVAVAVNPENDYLLVKVKSDEQPVIVGKEAVKILKADAVEVLREFKGSELVGKEFEAVFPSLEVQEFKHTIVAWDEVNAEEGTGAVHIAPGCGQEDHELGKELGLVEICPIDESGVFYDNFGFLSGLTSVESAQVVFDELEKQNKLYYTHKYKHSYPVCWRCKTEIVFRLIDSWCIKVDDLRPQLVEAIKDVEWQPAFLEKRMMDWLENMGDWHISRNRFYGVPLPIYPCECGHVNIIGSKEELIERSSKKEVDAMPHLHRPHVDNIEIECAKCDRKVKRITDVGDTWLDAGITPFSTKKYFTDRDFFDKNFPAENVIEMREQIRLWFYSLLVMSVTLTGKAPYKKIVGYAAMVQEDGSKFSKSGFMFKVADLAKETGLDSSRYLSASVNINNDFRFGLNMLNEVKRKLLGLWNAYTFFNTYAVIDKPELDGYTPKYEELNVTDKWLVNVTNEFIEKCDKYYENTESYNVTKEFETYVDKLTNFYIRVNRRRFWKSDNKADQMNAYWSLYTALKAAIQVISPILPFMTEYIWQNMVRAVEVGSAESIYLSDFPTSVLITPKTDIIEQVSVATNIINIGQRLRAENQLKVKQPLAKIFVKANKMQEEAMKLLEDIIKEELNVKQVIAVEDENQFNVPYLTVNFGKAGKVLKGDVQKVKDLLENATEEQMVAFVKGFDEGKIAVEGFDELDSELFERKLKAKAEYVIAVEDDLTVVLDTVLNVGLKQEGYLREVVRQAQILRKEAGFEIDDRIIMQIVVSEGEEDDVKRLVKTLKRSDAKIKEEVLANALNVYTNKIYNAEEGFETSTVKVADQIVVIRVKKDETKVTVATPKPDNVNIVYEDNHILVVIKPQNVPVQEDSSKDKDLTTMLKEYIKVKYNKPGNVYLGLLHRLDRPTGGLMIFAKTSKAGSRISEDFRERRIEKHYLAVLLGTPRENRVKLVHYLKKDSKNNIVSVVPELETGGKRAELNYSILERNNKFSLVEVALKTGRSHQIRVQMAHIKHPVFGDVKYKGNIVRGQNMALWAYKLKFTHPTTRKIMSFISFPDEELMPWKYFNIAKHIVIK
jgi:isoleucyl-tRNA synthetase